MSTNMRKLIIIIPLLILFITGCLTTEKKEYKFKINKDGSGEVTITYLNLISQKDEGRDVSFKDFAELISDYYEGNKVENDYPGSRMISRRLFEKNGVLNGEFVLKFDSLKTFKLFQYDNNSPFMFHVDAFSETYVESNGDYNSEIMPIVFWDKNTKELYIKTQVTDLTYDDTSYVSLIDQYRKWKKNN